MTDNLEGLENLLTNAFFHTLHNQGADDAYKFVKSIKYAASLQPKGPLRDCIEEVVDYLRGEWYEYTCTEEW